MGSNMEDIVLKHAGIIACTSYQKKWLTDFNCLPTNDRQPFSWFSQPAGELASSDRSYFYPKPATGRWGMGSGPESQAESKSSASTTPGFFTLTTNEGVFQSIGQVPCRSLSTVYIASGREGQKVVIKVVAAPYVHQGRKREGCQQELLAHGLLGRKNIRFYQEQALTPVDTGYFYLVFPYWGKSLDEWREQESWKDLPIPLRCQWSKEAYRQLRLLMHFGLFPTDLKPANVLVSQEKHLRLIDFSQVPDRLAAYSRDLPPAAPYTLGYVRLSDADRLSVSCGLPWYGAVLRASNEIKKQVNKIEYQHRWLREQYEACRNDHALFGEEGVSLRRHALARMKETLQFRPVSQPFSCSSIFYYVLFLREKVSMLSRKLNSYEQKARKTKADFSLSFSDACKIRTALLQQLMLQQFRYVLARVFFPFIDLKVIKDRRYSPSVLYVEMGPLDHTFFFLNQFILNFKEDVEQKSSKKAVSGCQFWLSLFCIKQRLIKKSAPEVLHGELERLFVQHRPGLFYSPKPFRTYLTTKSELMVVNVETLPDHLVIRPGH